MEWGFLKQCPLCGEKGFKTHLNLGSVKVSQCGFCGLQFLNPHLSPASMAEVYSTTGTMHQANALLGHYYDSFQDTQTERFYRQILELIAPLKSGGSLLDIGCGRGHFLSLARDFGWSVTGLEPAQEHAQYGIEKLGIEIRTSTLEKAHFEEASFDVITLWDVIEHVPDPGNTLNRISRWLKKDGLLLLATPNHRSLLNFLAYTIYFLSGGIVKGPLRYFFVPEHVLYFTPSTLRRLVKQCGLEPIREVKSGTDIDRYAVGPWVKITAKILMGLAKVCGAENRITVICRNSSI